VELRITDGERARYLEIYGRDPLARDGWLTLRMKRELAVLGVDIASDFDLLASCDGQTLEAPARRAGVVAQIDRKRDKDASIFSVAVRWR
jgi:hypothetical protein